MEDQPSSSSKAGTGEEVRLGLLMSHQRRLFQFILSIAPNLSDAEDILQESNVVLWRKFDQFEAGTNFFGWASRIAQLQVLKHRKKMAIRRTLVLDEHVIELVAGEAAENTDYAEGVKTALKQCIGKLRPEDQDLISRRYTTGASGKRVAEDLKRPLNSIYKSLGRIRQALLECINRSTARTSAARN